MIFPIYKYPFDTNLGTDYIMYLLPTHLLYFFHSGKDEKRLYCICLILIKKDQFRLYFSMDSEPEYSIAAWQPGENLF